MSSSTTSTALRKVGSCWPGGADGVCGRLATMSTLATRTERIISASCGIGLLMTLCDAGFLHDRQRRIESELRALLGRHSLRHTAKRLRADAAVVTDLLQRLEEADEIDHALTRHHALIVADLLRRLSFGVRHMHVDDTL